MRQHMMIIGCNIIRSSSEPGKRDGIMEVTLVPLSTVKVKKPGLMDMATGGIEKLISQVQDAAPKQSKIIISIGEWIECKYRIGCHVTLELLPDTTTGGLSYD